MMIVDENIAFEVGASLRVRKVFTTDFFSTEGCVGAWSHCRQNSGSF